MDQEQFWSILKAAYGAEESTSQEWFNSLKNELLKLPPEEILAFAKEFDKKVGAAYKTDLWGAGYLINGGCSDDGSARFRDGTGCSGTRDPQALSRFGRRKPAPHRLVGLAGSGHLRTPGRFPF